MNLVAQDLSLRYGAVVAVSRVSLRVDSGERRGLIGPNGAGKSTLFGLLAGEIRPDSGSITFDGRDVTSLAAWRRGRLGLGRTFQRSTLFPQLTVVDNVAVVIRRRRGTSWSFRSGAAEREVMAEATERLATAGLSGLAHRPAGTLGHGEQRMVEIELALAGEPRLLLLDEPLAGLSADERKAIGARILELPAAVTIVMVEHDLDFVFAGAERISVLDHGVLIAEGTPQEVRADPRVQEVYIGGA